MWQLLGKKSQLIIGKKSRKFARYYRRVLSKKRLYQMWHPLGSKPQLLVIG